MICRAIDSVLNQTYSNVEVIIVDDNIPSDEYSHDLAQVISLYKDPRVKLVKQDVHINGARARNVGVNVSTGEYIAFLDDDDEWLPSKIEKQLCYLNDNPNCSGCSCYYNEYLNNTLVHSVYPYTADDLFLKIFRREVSVFTSTVLLKKKILLDAGLFDEQLMRHQDLQLLLTFTAKYKLGVCPEYLVKMHNDSDINRPSIDKFIKVKEDFFYSVKDLYLSCTPENQKLIKSAHLFELAFAALKQRRVFVMLRYLLRVPISLNGYKLLFNRMKNRKYKAEIL